MHAQAYGLDRMTGASPVDFLARHCSVWPLVLPTAPVEKILAVPGDGNWASVAAELREAYSSGPLGVKLFATPVSMILDAQMQAVTHEGLRKLAAKPKIIGDDVLERKRSVNLAIEILPGVDAIPWGRTCSLSCCAGVVMLVLL